jgi:NAD+ synthase (glutamine-hydrolysing)
MPTLRIALAQVNATVGDLAGNAAVVHGYTRRAAEAGAHLVAFPEMMLTGYPVEDLTFRESFVSASRNSLERLAADLDADGLGGIAAVVGYLDADGPARLGADAEATRGPRDALALLFGGRVVTRYYKHHLPNYGVFDEDRYFVP